MMTVVIAVAANIGKAVLLFALFVIFADVLLMQIGYYRNRYPESAVWSAWLITVVYAVVILASAKVFL